MSLTRPTAAQINSVIEVVTDPLSLFNNKSTQANVDVGFILNRDGGTNSNIALVWQETNKQFAIGLTTANGATNANVSFISYANVKLGNLITDGNVSAAYFTGSGQFLTGLPASYSNVNVKAYTESMGYTNYSNVNLIAYLAGGITSTGFINTTANVSAAQINSATAVVTGSAFFGELFVKSPGGDEGGQINLANAVTNTTLVGNVVIDVFQNKLRIFEGGGTARGGYFDISGLAAGVATNLAAGGGGGSPGGGQGQIQFNSSSTFQGAASLYYFGANGAIVANAGIASTSTTTGTMQITGGIGVTGNVTADIFNSANNGNGTNFKVGDDVWLGDINIANTLGIKGQQDGTQGYIRFGNVNTNALGVSGSGPLTWGGVLNVTGNILGATGTLSALNVNGLINTTGNILSTGLSVFGNTRIGSLATPGALHTIIGNVDVTGAGTEYFNIGGNIMAIQASFGSINSTGLINTTGNILSTGLSVFGNTRIGSLATPGALHTIIGNVDVSGAGTEFFNIGGNIMAIQGSFGSINSTGLINTTGNVLVTTGVFNNVIVNTGNINAVGGYFVGNGAFLSGIVSGGGAGNTSIYVSGNVTAIFNGGTNGVGNIGATGATFNTVFAKATQAQYADLAEVYTSDQQYSAGTVVIFGGDQEVTQSRASHDTRIAGVVSTNPAYLMNSTATGVPVALQGRVPCRVLGPVSQGDCVVSSHISGVAQRLDLEQYQPGCIIGKALQAVDSTDISIIEVVVGRL
jgi:hypothetical protein